MTNFATRVIQSRGRRVSFTDGDLRSPEAGSKWGAEA